MKKQIVTILALLLFTAQSYALTPVAAVRIAKDYMISKNLMIESSNVRLDVTYQSSSLPVAAYFISFYVNETNCDSQHAFVAVSESGQILPKGQGLWSNKYYSFNTATDWQCDMSGDWAQ